MKIEDFYKLPNKGADLDSKVDNSKGGKKGDVKKEAKKTYSFTLEALRDYIKSFFTDPTYGLDKEFIIGETRYNEITENGYRFLKGSGGIKIKSLYYKNDFTQVIDVVK